MGKWNDLDAKELQTTLFDKETYASLKNDREKECYNKEHQLFAAMMTSDSQQQLEDCFSQLMKYTLREEFRAMAPECTDEELDELKIDQLATTAKLDFAYDAEHKTVNLDAEFWDLSNQFETKRDLWLEQMIDGFTPETKNTIEKLNQLNKERTEAKKLAEQKKLQEEAEKKSKEKEQEKAKEEPKAVSEIKPEPEKKPEVKKPAAPKAKEKDEESVVIDYSDSSAIKLALHLAQKIGAKGETDFMKALNDGVISFADSDGNLQRFDTKKGFREAAKAINEKVNGHRDVFLRIPQKDGTTADFKLDTINRASGDILNIRPMEEVRKEWAAKDAADRAKYKEIPQETIGLFQKAVTSLSGKVDATGTSMMDSKEFKDMKSTLARFSVNGDGVPTDPRAFLSCMNQLEEKAFDYFYSQLDKSPNKRDEARFNQAATLLETISAIKEGREPSRASMEKNIIACKAVKANYILKSKSKDPAKAEKAANILFSKHMFKNKVQALQGKDKFKNLFDGKSPEELHEISTKIAKEVNKTLHSEKVQTKEPVSKKNQGKMAL